MGAYKEGLYVEPLSGSAVHNKNNLIVGLFGTCGSSRWRDEFIRRYDELGIPFFNPQVEHWTSELAEIEAQHLANDQLLLFPVTSETYGTGSLAEVGFSILSSLRWNADRRVVLYIDPQIAPELKEQSPDAAKESLRSRKLVRAHLAQLKHPNVFVVDSLDAMLEISITLFNAMILIERVRS